MARLFNKMKAPEKVWVIYSYFVNGKEYIGQSWKLKTRHQAHLNGKKQHIDRALNKYKWDRKRLPDILVGGIQTQEEADWWEVLLIWDRDTFYNGYNEQKGGELTGGGQHSDATKEKLRVINIGRKMPREAVERAAAKKRGQPAWNRGIARSEVVKRKISQTKTGAPNLKLRGKPKSEAHRRKLSIARKGKKLPPRTKEHSARISAGLNRHYAAKKGLLFLV